MFNLHEWITKYQGLIDVIPSLKSESRVKILYLRPGILTDDFRGFSQSLQVNAGVFRNYVTIYCRSEFRCRMTTHLKYDKWPRNH